ncbi:MAG: hypothetical protein BMS9Abin29_0885 [Gemmatimonadota bacterium]|nr:MAG: hypothetical protein BMS9Abin29_0885 [Gemmatimonadota bacterium]
MTESECAAYPRTGVRRRVEEQEAPQLNLGLALAFMAIVVGGIADLWFDDPESWVSLHVILEVTMVAGSLGLAILLWFRWARTARTLGYVSKSLEARRVEHEEWLRRARAVLEGLGRAMDDQFARWELTPAERDTALGLLKGYSLKRIATSKNRSERTVRQHAVSVYRKAGLAGRAELSAFFLQDVMLPTTTAPPEGAAGCDT